MKKLKFLTFLLAILAINACQKDSQELTDDQLIQQIEADASKLLIEPSGLPAEMSAFLEENYFETYIESAYKSPERGYEVRLGDENRVYCDMRGRVLRHRRGAVSTSPCGRGEAVRPSQLPAAITDYIAENYPGAQAQRAKQLESGVYFVKIDNPGYILIFRGNGAFIEATVLFYHCRPLGLPIDVASLPASISDYISANFSGAEIMVAFQKNNGMTIIGLSTIEGRKIVGFDANGNFLFVRP